MARKSRQDPVKGPLSDEALEIITRHFSWLADTPMVLDPDAFGHEIFDENRARYQWKVEGGRTSDYQGITLRVGGDPDVYVITHNRVEVIIKIRTPRGQTVDELIRANQDDVVPPTFKAVFSDAMRPYEGLV